MRRRECRLVEERFSLFRSFAEPPFLGFRGVVARAGCEYDVMVAAEMDFYPQYLPWAFVTPSIAGAREDGKVLIDLPWDREGSRFADVIGAVITYIEVAQRTRVSARLTFDRLGAMKTKSAGDTDCSGPGSIGLQSVPSAVRLLQLRFGRCDSRSRRVHAYLCFCTLSNPFSNCVTSGVSPDWRPSRPMTRQR